MIHINSKSKTWATGKFSVSAEMYIRTPNHTKGNGLLMEPINRPYITALHKRHSSSATPFHSCTDFSELQLLICKLAIIVFELISLQKSKELSAYMYFVRSNMHTNGSYYLLVKFNRKSILNMALFRHECFRGSRCEIYQAIHASHSCNGGN